MKKDKKEIVVCCRIKAELNDKLNEMAEANNLKKSAFLSQFIENCMNDNSNDPQLQLLKDKNEILENQIIEYQKQIEEFSNKHTNDFENYINNHICLNINKLHTNVIAMLLEIKEKSKANTMEMMMLRLYNLFKQQYGNVEQKYIDKAIEVKSKII